jgi:hypothetical protein
VADEVEALANTLDGLQSVSFVGHSLGGIYIRCPSITCCKLVDNRRGCIPLKGPRVIRGKSIQCQLSYAVLECMFLSVV